MSRESRVKYRHSQRFDIRIHPIAIAALKHMAIKRDCNNYEMLESLIRVEYQKMMGYFISYDNDFYDELFNCPNELQDFVKIKNK